MILRGFKMNDLKDRLSGLKTIYKIVKTKMLLAKIETLEMEIHRMKLGL